MNKRKRCVQFTFSSNLFLCFKVVWLARDQALHLAISLQVTHERHAKGDASGNKETLSPQK